LIARWLAAVALLSTLVACGGAPKSKLPRNNVLRFGVSHMGGSVSFVVRNDGTAVYETSRGPEGDLRVDSKVSKAEMQKLAETLTQHDCCSLTSSRTSGVADEARPGFSVRLGELDCEVSLWDGEFRDDEDAKACLAAVEGLGTKLRSPHGSPR